MALSNITRVNQTRPKVERITMGRREYIDTDTEYGYLYWVSVVQDEYMADYYIDQLNNRGSVRVNEGTEYVEVWNVLSSDRWSDALMVLGVHA